MKKGQQERRDVHHFLLSHTHGTPAQQAQTKKKTVEGFEPGVFAEDQVSDYYVSLCYDTVSEIIIKIRRIYVPLATFLFKK